MKRFTKVCLVLGILLLVAGAAAAGASYLLGVEQDIRAAMNPPEPEVREVTIPGAELGRLEISLFSDDVKVEVSAGEAALAEAGDSLAVFTSLDSLTFANIHQDE